MEISTERKPCSLRYYHHHLTKETAKLHKLQNDTFLAFLTSQVVLVVKKPSANAVDARDTGFDPWVGKIPWRRKWHPTPVFLHGKSPEQRRLAGYGPWGCKGTRASVMSDYL